MTQLNNYISFVVLNEDYLDAALVCLNTYFKYNATPVVAYCERGGNYERLKQLKNVFVKIVDFPKSDFFSSVGGDKLLIDRKGVPAISQRLIALDELKQKYDIILNFDLDTIFLKNVDAQFDYLEQGYIYGVSERENRNRWITKYIQKDIAPNSPYLNTGLIFYTKGAIKDTNIYNEYLKLIAKEGGLMVCPEQDFINYKLSFKARCLPSSYNLMYTCNNYDSIAPRMLHFLGDEKPFKDSGFFYDRRVYTYFGRYFMEAKRLKNNLSHEFLEKISKMEQKIML